MQAAVLFVGSAAWGGFNPFVLKLEARAGAYPEGDITDTEFDVSNAPVEAEYTGAESYGYAWADFTTLKVYSSDVSAPCCSSFGRGLAIANDTLTVSPVGSPAGVARVEITWQIAGSISNHSNSSVVFVSSYSRSTTEFLGDTIYSAGSLIISGLSTVNQSVTFVYDDVPIGALWNISTFLRADADGVGSVVDFDDSAILTGIEFYIDNVLTDATVVGESGMVYQQHADCGADVNGDGIVDVNDISYVLFRLGDAGAAPVEGDANGDEVVDVNDISYVLFRLGTPC